MYGHFTCPEIFWHVSDKRIGTISKPVFIVCVTLVGCVLPLWGVLMFVGRVAVLDEATSQLGLGMERKLYAKCRDLDITLLSVGHRDTLRQFHDVELRLNGQDVTWSLQEIHDTSDSVAVTTRDTGH